MVPRMVTAATAIISHPLHPRLAASSSGSIRRDRVSSDHVEERQDENERERTPKNQSKIGIAATLDDFDTD